VVAIKEHVRRIAGPSLATALATVAIAVIVRTLPRPRTVAVGWLNAPSAIPREIDLTWDSSVIVSAAIE
jgi:hypothetical protein